MRRSGGRAGRAPPSSVGGGWVGGARLSVEVVGVDSGKESQEWSVAEPGTGSCCWEFGTALKENFKELQSVRPESNEG